MPVSKSRRKSKRTKKKHGPSIRLLEDIVVLDLASEEDLLGYEKMSDLLCDFVEPYVPEGLSLYHYKHVVGLAALAWNLSLIPEDERRVFLSRMATGVTPVDYVVMYLIEELIYRKKLHFAEYTRLITNYQISMRKGSFYVQVEYIEYDGSKNRASEPIMPGPFQETRPKSSWWAM